MGIYKTTRFRHKAIGNNITTQYPSVPGGGIFQDEVTIIEIKDIATYSPTSAQHLVR